MSEDQVTPASNEATQQPAAPEPPKQSHADLIAALCKAQHEIFNPVKNKQVDVQGKEGKRGFGYEYAELNVVLEIIRLPLAKNNLTFTQTPVPKGNMWYVLTRLMHASDTYIDFWYPLHPKQNMSQEQGFASGFTYAKRQALKGIFGIADDSEDTDGQDTGPGSGVTIKPKNHAPPPAKPHSAGPGAKAQASKTDHDDLDAALGNDPMPDYSNEPVTLLDELLAMVNANGVPHEEMPGIIRKVTGRTARAQELGEEDLKKVIQFVAMFKSKKTE